MKYKVGDKVTLTNGNIMTIDQIDDISKWYRMREDPWNCYTDEMIEGLVEEEAKPEPKFKVGDFVFSGINSCAMKVINSCYDEHWRYQIFDDVNEYWFFEKELKKVEIGDVVYSKVWKEKVIVRNFCDDKFILVTDFKGKLLKSLPSLIKQIKEKEETKNNNNMEEKEILLGWVKESDSLRLVPHKDYEIKHDGNIFYLVKKYPKIYEECAEIIAELTGSDCNPKGCMGYMSAQLTALQKLLICRAAYWKIAGDKMGLGKPWEPDYKKERYIICKWVDEILTGYRAGGFGDRFILEFPTKEMRDAFKENFDPDIEICKELL